MLHWEKQLALNDVFGNEPLHEDIESNINQDVQYLNHDFTFGLFLECWDELEKGLHDFSLPIAGDKSINPVSFFFSFALIWRNQILNDVQFVEKWVQICCIEHWIKVEFAFIYA